MTRIAGTPRSPYTTGPRTLTLRLPLPPAALNPNARPHRMAKWRAGSAYRATVAYEVLASGATWAPEPTPYRAGIALRFVACGRAKPWDADNCQAGFKPGLDGLVDAHLLLNDSARHVEITGVVSEHCPRGCRCGGYVEITVTEVEA